MKNNKTRTLCEAAIFIAMAEILSFIKLYEFPNGGSVTLEMVADHPVRCPVWLRLGRRRRLRIRHRDLSHRQQVLHRLDHHHLRLLPGLHGAGLWRGLLARRKWSVFYGTVIGGVLRFLAHYIIGAVVWGKYMPDEFFGMTMTSPWFYSLLYNGSYMLPSIILCLVVFAALYKPMKKYFTAEDLKLAQ